MLPAVGQGEPRGEKRVFRSTLGERVSGVTTTATPVPSLSRGGVCEVVMVHTSCRERSTTHSALSRLGLGAGGGQRACRAARDPEEPDAPGVRLGVGPGPCCQRVSSRGLCSRGLGAAGGVSELGEAVREPY